MHFYNQNQIEMMKIKSGDLEIKNIKTKYPELKIKQVLQPFEE